MNKFKDVPAGLGSSRANFPDLCLFDTAPVLQLPVGLSPGGQAQENRISGGFAPNRVPIIRDASCNAARVLFEYLASS